MRIKAIGIFECSNCCRKNFFKIDDVVFVTKTDSEKIDVQRVYCSCKRCNFPNFLKYLPKSMTESNGFSA